MADGPLKIQQLRYVVAAVESGGFKAAADRLHRTQPEPDPQIGIA